jgi:periplasmic protein TonB
MIEDKRNFPGLDDLAFAGRNKEYGAYLLRKKYRKYLMISLITGTFLMLLLVFVPFISYYIEGNRIYSDTDMLYSVAYDFMQTPENNLTSIPGLKNPVMEVPKPPKVVDSVPEKKKVKEEIKPDEKKDENQDTIAKGKGESQQGAGEGDEAGIYTTIDVFPKYPGGDFARLAFIRNNAHIPEAAYKAGVQGVVMVVFVIETDGTLSNIQVTKGLGSGCDEEAIRVIKLMPRWEPGRRSGRPVKVMVKMPIVFKIPGRT